MSTDQFGVAGQTTLITGASQGIGRVTAERFAADGADVVQFLASRASSYMTGETVEAKGVPRIEESPEV